MAAKKESEIRKDGLLDKYDDVPSQDLGLRRACYQDCLLQYQLQLEMAKVELVHEVKREKVRIIKYIHIYSYAKSEQEV